MKTSPATQYFLRIVIEATSNPSTQTNPLMLTGDGTSILLD